MGVTSSVTERAAEKMRPRWSAGIVNHGTYEDLARCLGFVTDAPSRILGSQTGSLAVGAAADVCVFNPDAEWSAGELNSRGQNCPYKGWMLKGRSTTTVVGGKIIPRD